MRLDNPGTAKIGNVLLWCAFPLMVPFIILLCLALWTDQWLRPSDIWHRWFAWYPVNCHGNYGIRWLEGVERRSNGTFMQYRTLEQAKYGE